MYFGERMANCRHFPSFHTFFYFFFSYILNLSRDQLYLIHFFFFLVTLMLEIIFILQPHLFRLVTFEIGWISKAA